MACTKSTRKSRTSSSATSARIRFRSERRLRMTDPAAIRRPKGWPFFAIALLIVLLSGFLYLRWRKREEGPVVVKEPVPISKPVEPPPVPPTPPPTPPPAAGFDLRVAELKKAVDEKRWD